MDLCVYPGQRVGLVGAIGCGKSMLGNRLPGILSEHNEDDAFDAAAIRSVSGRAPLDPARTPR